MAIKERKQITGTEAQIKDYAGHNGVLAYATDTKHLHVLSGTAGTTTKLANMSDIPAPVDISGKADKTYVDTELAKKQTKGDYATNTALTQGLAGKASSSHTHTTEQITDMPKAVLSVNGVTPGKGGDVSIKIESMMPNYSSFISLKEGDFKPTYNGWLILRLAAGADNRSFTVKHVATDHIILEYGQFRYPGYGVFMCPLRAREAYTIKSSDNEIYFHKMYDLSI